MSDYWIDIIVLGSMLIGPLITDLQLYFIRKAKAKKESR